MRNKGGRKQPNDEYVKEKRQRILFESFESTTALSSEIKTSLELLKQLKAQQEKPAEKTAGVNIDNPVAASRVVQDELSKTLANSRISDANFEIHKIDQQHTLSNAYKKGAVMEAHSKYRDEHAQ